MDEPRDRDSVNLIAIEGEVGDLVAEIVEMVPADPWEEVWAEDVLPDPSRPLQQVCRCCHGCRWWRLKGGGPAVCQRCHPCPYGDDSVEQWEGAK